jgi:hypothetical protein
MRYEFSRNLYEIVERTNKLDCADKKCVVLLYKKVFFYEHDYF